LKALKLYETVQPKIVMGNTVSQAFQFVDTGNAEIGFVAPSQLTRDAGGSRWMVPQNLYSEIRQDAVNHQARGVPSQLELKPGLDVYDHLQHVTLSTSGARSLRRLRLNQFCSALIANERALV
jgi:hypothetical protein